MKERKRGYNKKKDGKKTRGIKTPFPRKAREGVARTLII